MLFGQKCVKAFKLATAAWHRRAQRKSRTASRRGRGTKTVKCFWKQRLKFSCPQLLPWAADYLRPEQPRPGSRRREGAARPAPCPAPHSPACPGPLRGSRAAHGPPCPGTDSGGLVKEGRRERRRDRARPGAAPMGGRRRRTEPSQDGGRSGPSYRGGCGAGGGGRPLREAARGSPGRRVWGAFRAAAGLHHAAGLEPRRRRSGVIMLAEVRALPRPAGVRGGREGRERLSARQGGQPRAAVPGGRGAAVGGGLGCSHRPAPGPS